MQAWAESRHSVHLTPQASHAGNSLTMKVMISPLGGKALGSDQPSEICYEQPEKSSISFDT